jgi:hypothetical protein
MSRLPAVSVVMPVRNAEAYLRSSVASVLSQKGIDLELIVVENGSNDGTPRILEELAQSDSRIRVLRSDPPGLTAALIAGCAAARADVIARQDAGDRSLPERLGRQFALLEADPSLVLVSCAVRYVGPEGEELYDAAERDGEAVRRSLLLDDASHIRGINHHGTAMFRRKAYLEAGGYRPQFRFAQDLDLWIRLGSLGAIAFLAEALYVATITPDSISGTHRAEQVALTRLAVMLRDASTETDRTALLAEAAQVGAGAPKMTIHRTASGYYFIGSCLRRRGDARARRYLAACVRRNPLHWRGWAALLASYAGWRSG